MKAHTVSTEATTVADATELDAENEVMVEAKEEQDLYDSLDDLVKKNDDPEKVTESWEELSLRYIHRLKTIVEKKTELLKKRSCGECVKRAEVEKYKERLLEEKEKVIAEKTKEVNEKTKEVNDLKQSSQIIKETNGEVVKENTELKTELEESNKLVTILTAAVNKDEVEVIKPKDKVTMDKPGKHCL